MYVTSANIADLATFITGSQSRAGRLSTTLDHEESTARMFAAAPALADTRN